MRYESVFVEPGHAVQVPETIPTEERLVWARGYLAAKRDFRRFEAVVPRTCDDLPEIEVTR